MEEQSRKDIIKKSHQRSENFGIDKDQLSSNKVLSEKELQALLKEETGLEKTAKPIIDNFYNLLKNTGFIIILTDENACVLNVTGDEDTLERAKVSNIYPGVYLNEENIGTNAMGTAIKENAAVQISAKEHFIQAFHVWTCSAAPIHDPGGKLIGTLNFTANEKLVHPHTLALVSAAVTAIEQSLENQTTNRLLSDSHQHAFSMMNNLTFGIMTVTRAGSIEWINDFACTRLNIKRSVLINKPASAILSQWPDLLSELLEGKKIIDRETQLGKGRDTETFIMSGFSMPDLNGKYDGAVLTFREMERIIRLVNKYTGMQARFSFDDIIAKSKKMKEVVEYARTVADSPSTILIQGDSGTGKEVFAQAIHNASQRNQYGFVALNCGAIPPNLIESELFGYAEGAFTGARKGGHPGKFELAHQGTLFLDEIGEMPMDMQVRLLRAIQEGSFTRVGGDKPKQVDIRIIAATNKDLKQEIDQGNFRLDLYYRLSVIPLQIPPLKERIEDITPLVKYFLRKKSLKLNKKIPRLSEQLVKNLHEYPWPGNIRELENFIEKAVLLDGHAELGNHLPRHEQNMTGPRFLAFPQETSAEKLLSLEEIEKQSIIHYLDLLNNNVSNVAKALNISRNTLYLKMKKYGIVR